MTFHLDEITALTAHWSKEQDDIVYYWPGKKADSRLIHNMLYGLVGGTNIVEELIKRGYDITTLTFSVKKRTTQ